MVLGLWKNCEGQELWPAGCPGDFISRIREEGIGSASDWPIQCFYECPTRGSSETVQDPAMTADRCFVAGSIRLPDAEHLGETASQLRDIDLDGVPERLEIRGAGNASKAIYIFRESPAGYRYLGELNAHPMFFVARDHENKLVILNFLRQGAGEVYLQYIEYLDDEFKVVRQDRIGR